MPDLQAARGASLSSGAHPRSPSSVPDDAVDLVATDVTQPGRRRALLAFAVAGTALVVDLVSKHLAVRELTGREPVPVIGDLLQLQLVRNPGAAFSAGAGLTPVITVIALVAAVVAAYYAAGVRHRGWAVALGLLLAGVGGNLVDRLFRTPGPFRGHVVDFFALPNWPVFNVADLCINAAGVLIVVLLVRGVRLDGTLHGSEDPAESTAAERDGQ